MTFNEILKKITTDKRTNLASLAKEISVSASFLEGFLTHSGYTMDISKANKIAQYFGMSLIELLTYAGNTQYGEAIPLEEHKKILTEMELEVTKSKLQVAEWELKYSKVALAAKI